MAEQITAWEVWAALGVQNEAEFRAKLDAAARYAEQTGKRINNALGNVSIGGAGGSTPTPGQAPSQAPGASSPNAPWPFGGGAPTPPSGGGGWKPGFGPNAPPPPPPGPAYQPNSPAGQLAAAGTQFGLKAAYVLRNILTSGPAGMAGGAAGGLAGLATGLGAGPLALLGSALGQSLASMAGGHDRGIGLALPGLAYQRNLAERDREAAEAMRYSDTYRQGTAAQRLQADFAASGGRTAWGGIVNQVDQVGNDFSAMLTRWQAAAQVITVKPGSGTGAAASQLAGHIFSSADDVYRSIASQTIMQDMDPAKPPTGFAAPRPWYLEKDPTPPASGSGLYGEGKGSGMPVMAEPPRRFPSDVPLGPSPPRWLPRGEAKSGPFDFEPGEAKGGGLDAVLGVLKLIHGALADGTADQLGRLKTIIID